MYTDDIYPLFCETDEQKADHIAFTATVRSLDFAEQQEAARLLRVLLKPCAKCGYDATVTVCPKCGTDKKDNSNYCLQCGHIYYKSGGY